MKVTLKIYASLREYTEGKGTFEFDLPQGSDVSHLLDRVKIPAEEVKNIMVNGRRSKLDKPVSDGDRVAVFPAIAGG
jgi:molybdopterin converting factor small subunit